MFANEQGLSGAFAFLATTLPPDLNTGQLIRCCDKAHVFHMDMMPKGADIGKWNRKSNAKNAIELVLA